MHLILRLHYVINLIDLPLIVFPHRVKYNLYIYMYSSQNIKYNIVLQSTYLI